MNFPDVIAPPLVTINPWSIESLGVVLARYTTNLSGATTTSNTWQAANTALFVPFSIFTTTKFVQMFAIHGTTATGNVDLGIYDENGTRLVSMGSTAQAGTSAMVGYNITDTTLTPGLYFMAIVASSTSSTFITATAPTTAATLKVTGMYQMASALPLPATATFATISTITRVPVFGLTTNTLL